MSDLVVIGYPNEETAGRAWDELTRRQQGYLADLEDAAIVRRGQKGKLRITTRPITLWPGAPSAACSGAC